MFNDFNAEDAVRKPVLKWWMLIFKGSSGS